MSICSICVELTGNTSSISVHFCWDLVTVASIHRFDSCSCCNCSAFHTILELQ